MAKTYKRIICYFFGHKIKNTSWQMGFFLGDKFNDFNKYGCLRCKQTFTLKNLQKTKWYWEKVTPKCLKYSNSVVLIDILN